MHKFMYLFRQEQLRSIWLDLCPKTSHAIVIPSHIQAMKWLQDLRNTLPPEKQVTY